MIQPLTTDTLIQNALNDQADLSAVERFSDLHDAGATPAQEKYYRDLLPASPPGPGQQYAFEVNLDACTGCKACVAACHSMNGLQEEEAWRDTGLLLSSIPEKPYQQTVTTACHHCLEPGCLKGCPTKAYVKDQDTGIVRHLDDQCFGCNYCTLMCPYDVPKYSPTLGIVRKCDMCHQRLAKNEAPACVQACPSQAIRISLINKDSLRQKTQNSQKGILPGTPASSITLPTTRYTSNKPTPDAIYPADEKRLHLQHPHLPLMTMLVMTQAAAGLFLLHALLQTLTTLPATTHLQLTTGALITCFAALGISLLHLGRPQYAFRAILGWKTSWLSREIIAFGAFSHIALTYTALLWAQHLSEKLPPLLTDPLTTNTLLTLTALSGLAGVYCSIMVYVDTQRITWSLPQTGSKFTLTTLLLGLAGAQLIAPSTPLHLALILSTLAKIAIETHLIKGRKARHDLHTTKSAKLILGPLKKMTHTRIALALTCGLLLPLIALITPPHLLLGTTILLGLFAEELLERYQFFSCMSAPAMPKQAAR